MLVDDKYYRNNTVHKSIVSIEDSVNNSISCGFLEKKGAECIQRDILFQNYGGLYVVSGTGDYIDAASGRRYPIYPGCIVQRMPNILHHTFINRESKWLEFYFCAGADIFHMLCSLGLIRDTPVFYIGESQVIFDRLLSYMDTVSSHANLDNAWLIFEFQKLMYFLNSYQETDSSDTAILNICDYLKQNYKVGTNLTTLAKEFNIGYETMRKQFKRKLGCSIMKYCADLRINESKGLLLNQHLSVKEVALKLGYCDSYAFSNQFKKQTGMSPKKFLQT